MSLQYYKVIIITVLAPSDFSALKNFVRQPVHETRSKFCFVDSKFVIRNVFSSPTRNFFYLNPPVSNQNNSLGGRQVRLLAEREKFAQHVMVSAGVCFGGNGRLHFVDESAKVDSAYRYYVGRLLPSLVDDCARLLQYFAHLPARHTQLVPRRTGSKPTAQISLSKTSGLQIHPIEPLGLLCLGQCWRPITSAIRKRSPN